MCTAVFLVIVLGVVDPIVNELRLSGDLLRSKASLYVAESSAEDAVYRVKHNMIVNYATPIALNINDYYATTTVPDTAGVKTINTTGNDNANFRKIETKIVSGVGTDFYYGVQAGTGGFSLTGGGQINGNVYSNGSVTATNGVTVTGTIIAANPSTTTNATVGGGSYVGAVNVGTGSVGDVWAHTVTGAQVAGTIYCQTGTAATNHNNKECDKARSDPPQQNFPISDADIQIWKDYASAGTVFSGSKTVGSTGATIGPMKITGNLIVNGGGTLTLAGTVWVQGNITFTGGGKLALASGYGTSGGVLLADGLISLNGGSVYAGSGTAGSYPLIITTSSSDSAIDVSGGSGAVVLVAQNGTISLSGGTSARAMAANRIVVDTGGTVTYDAGLVNFNFSSGPSGGWNISSWKEVQ